MALGFREIGGRGSHRIFAKDGVRELVNLQEEKGQGRPSLTRSARSPPSSVGTIQLWRKISDRLPHRRALERRGRRLGRRRPRSCLLQRARPNTSRSSRLGRAGGRGLAGSGSCYRPRHPRAVSSNRPGPTNQRERCVSHQDPQPVMIGVVSGRASSGPEGVGHTTHGRTTEQGSARRVRFVTSQPL